MTDTNLAPAPVTLPPLKVLKAKQQFGSATRDRKNDHYGSDYATLESVLASVEPALHAEGLLLMQRLEMLDPRSPILTTQLWHAASGERIETQHLLAPDRTGTHALASCCTYWRRQQIKALLCLSETDDDGNASQGVQPQQRAQANTRTQADFLEQQTKAKAAQKAEKAVQKAFAKKGEQQADQPSSQQEPATPSEEDAGYSDVEVLSEMESIQTIPALQVYLGRVVPKLDSAGKKAVRAGYDKRFAELAKATQYA